jgi:hypothetical protein
MNGGKALNGATVQSNLSTTETKVSADTNRKKKAMNITEKNLNSDKALLKAFQDLTKATGNLTEVTLESYCLAGARVIANRDENGKSPKGNRAVDLQILSGGVYDEATKKYVGGLQKSQISRAVTVLEFHLKDIVTTGQRPTAEQCDEALQVALSQYDDKGQLIALYPQYLIATGKDPDDKGDRTPETLDTVARRLVKRAVAEGLNKDDIWELVLKAYYAETTEV